MKRASPNTTSQTKRLKSYIDPFAVINVVLDTLSYKFWYHWTDHELGGELPGFFICLAQDAPLDTLTLLYRKLEWVFDNNYLRSRFVKYIIMYNRMDFHKWRVDNKIDMKYIHSDWTGNAAYYGNIPFLEQLIAHGCDCPDNWVCRKAASGGRQNVLEWTLARNMKWTPDTCMEAAYENNFPLLQWLHRNGCPWDKETSEAIAEVGNFEMFKWAKEQGCPYDESIVYCAAESGAIPILELFEENGKDLLSCKDDPAPCWLAAGKGQFKTMRWLFKHGYAMDREALESTDRYFNNLRQWILLNIHDKKI